MLSTILVQRDKKGILLDAVTYNCSAAHANSLSPDAELLVALTPKRFKEVYSGNQIPDSTKQPTQTALQRWIKKIDKAPRPKQGGRREKGKHCAVELNAEKINKKKKSWQIFARSDVYSYILDEAKKRGYTITGLTETILIDWLNRNGVGKISKPPIATGAQKGAYVLGQIAAKEKEITGSVNFQDYVFSVPGKKLTSFRKSLISSYKYTEDVGKLFEAIPNTLITSALNPRNYIWFFAGFCGVDWAVIAEQTI